MLLWKLVVAHTVCPACTTLSSIAYSLLGLVCAVASATDCVCLLDYQLLWWKNWTIPPHFSKMNSRVLCALMESFSMRLRKTRSMFPACFPHSRDHIGSIVSNNCMNLASNAPLISYFCEELRYIVWCVLYSYMDCWKIARLHLPVLVKTVSRQIKISLSGSCSPHIAC